LARPYAPLEGRAAAAVGLVALACAGAVLFLLFEALGLIAALTTLSGSGVTLAGLVGLVGGWLAFLPGFVGGAIAVPIWMHRAVGNLQALGEQGTHWSPAWAAGGWFIPFANLVIPYLCLRELWNGFGDERPLPQQYWAAWFGAFVLQILGSVFQRLSASHLMDAGIVFGILNDVATIVAGFLLITMIWRISRRQRDRQVQLLAR
jgi:hypothetical protein